MKKLILEKGEFKFEERLAKKAVNKKTSEEVDVEVEYKNNKKMYKITHQDGKVEMLDAETFDKLYDLK